LQCVLAAKILTVDFVVCILAVKKKIRAGFDMSDQTIPLLVPVSRMMKLYVHFCIRLHGVALHLLSSGTVSPLRALTAMCILKRSKFIKKERYRR
jgi:hypothetical protein